MRKLSNLASLFISSILFFILTTVFAYDIKIVSFISLLLAFIPAIWFIVSLMGLVSGFINRTNEVQNSLLVVIGLFVITIIAYFGIHNMFWVHTDGYVSVTENNVYVSEDDQAYFIIEDIHYEVSKEVYEQLDLHVNFKYEAVWNPLDRGYSRHLQLNIK